eukprot:418653_1
MRVLNNLEESHAQRVPVWIDFSDVTFTIHKKKAKLVILNNISGHAKPGQFLAIIGASGAGKTSLLNILASRVLQVPDHTLTGKVTINGQSCDAHVVQSLTAYVTQEDILFKTFTPSGNQP